MPSRRRRYEEVDEEADSDEDSWGRSSDSGEDEDGEDYDGQVEISIEDIANFTIDFEHLDGQPVFSPRSVEACQVVGVDPYILIPEVHEDYEDLADQ